MKCFNVNLPEYKTLLEKYKEFAVVDTIINTWQSINKTDQYPSIEEAESILEMLRLKGELKSNDLRKMIFDNLLKNDFVVPKTDKSGNMVLKSFTEKGLKDLTKRLRNYFDFLGVSRDDYRFRFYRNTEGEYKATIEFDQNSLAQSTVDNTKEINSSVKLDFLISTLTKMFPSVTIKYLTAAEASLLYNNISDVDKSAVKFEDVKSFYYKGEAILIRDRVDRNTAIEEVLHPFVDVLLQDNPGLAKSIIDEAKSKYQDVVENVNDSYTDALGFTQKDRDVEILTKVLTSMLSNKIKDQSRNLIEKVFDWFKSIIESIGRTIKGRNYKVESLADSTSLTDIARLLSRGELYFDPSSLMQNKVRYALDPYYNNGYESIYSKANPIQKKLMDKAFKVVRDLDDDTVAQQFSVNDLNIQEDIVLLHEDTHTYFNPFDSSEQFISSTTAVSGKSSGKFSKEINVGNDFDSILEGIVMYKSLDQILNEKTLNVLNRKQAEEVYKSLSSHIEDIRNEGSIIIPQVVVNHRGPKYNIAGMIDLLVITKEGKFKIFDLKTSKHSIKTDQGKRKYESATSNFNILKPDSLIAQALGAVGLKLSNKDKHQLQVNMYARMLKNMGFEIDDSDPYSTATFHVKINYKKDANGNESYESFKVEGYDSKNLSRESENATYLDYIVPDMTDPKFGQSQKEMEAEEALSEINENFDLRSIFPNLDDDILNSLQALSGFGRALYNAKAVLAAVKKGIMFESDFESEIERLDVMSSLVNIAIAEGGQQAIRSINEILMMAHEEIKGYRDYILNKDNYSDPLFATKLSNFKAYKARFNSLISEELFRSGGVKKKELISNIRLMLNQLDGNTELPGSVKNATLKYLIGAVKDKDDRTLTDADIKEMIEQGEDIDSFELLLGNRGFTKDAIVSYADKTYKDKRHKASMLVDEIKTRISTVTKNLIEASGSSNPKDIYEFMLELNKDGNPERIIQKIGIQYYRLLDQYVDNIGNDEYIPLDPDEVPDPAIVQYNLDLRERKRALGIFRRAERENENKELIDGEYHYYDKEFKDAREKLMDYIESTDEFGGFWVYKDEAKRSEILKFEKKYYDIIPNYKVCNDEGFVSEKTLKLVKDKYVHVREVSDKGEDMRSQKYQKLMKEAHPSNQGNPGYELAKARLEYYESYMDLYGKAIQMIGQDNTERLMGEMIKVRSTFANELLTKPPFVIRMMSRVKNMFEGFVNMFSDDIQFSRNLENEAGETRDTIPIMYTGRFKDENKIEKLKSKQKETRERIHKLERSIDIADAEFKKAMSEGRETILFERKKNRLNEALKKEILINKDLSQKIHLATNAIENKEVSVNLSDSLLRFVSMAANYKYMNDIEDTFLLIQEKIATRNTVSSTSRLESVTKGALNKLAPKYQNKGESSLEIQFRTFMKNNLYGYDLSKKTGFRKFLMLLKTLNSVRLMGLNPFTSTDNLLQGLLENTIEAGAGKHISKRALRKGLARVFRSMWGDFRMRSQNSFKKTLGRNFENKPLTKVAALVYHYRMLDQTSDLREQASSFATLGSTTSQYSQDTIMNMLYFMQDAGEYMVQAGVGIGMLEDITVMHEDTKVTMSLYDAWEFNKATGELYIDPKYKIIKQERKEPPSEFVLNEWFKGKGGLVEEPKIIGDVDENHIFKTRYAIRNLNIMLHGSYALEDKNYLENFTIGALLMQFHKWVWEAGIQKYYGKRRYHATLGYTEGRMVTLWSYMGYLSKKMMNKKRNDDDGKDYSSFLAYSGFTGRGGENDRIALDILKNLHRAQVSIMSQLLLLLLRYLANALKENIEGEDEDDLTDDEKRVMNSLFYRIDKLYKEQTTFSWRIVDGVYQQFKSPIPIASFFGDIGEFTSTLFNTTSSFAKYKFGITSEDEYLDDKDVFYQRGVREGQAKLNKEFSDLLPLYHAWNKWINYVNQDEFFIPL